MSNGKHFLVTIDKQYVASTENDLITLFCGYISNKNAIAKKLKTSNTCTESVFASAYREWGCDLSEFVYGEYFVVFIDRTNNVVLATRDALGLRPGYYSVVDAALHLSSNLDLLVDQINPSELNENHISEILVQGQSCTFTTIYKGINIVPVSETLIYNSSLSFRKHWSLLNANELDKYELGNTKERFNDLISEAVRGTCDDEAPIVELSGGTDSSSVLSVCANNGLAPSAAISYIYSLSNSADERTWMKSVLNRYPSDWITLDEDLIRPFSSFPEKTPAEPSRLLTMWSSYTAYVEEIQKLNSKIVLSGFGGDQVFGGDITIPIHASEKIRNPFLLLRELWLWKTERDSDRPFYYHISQGFLEPLRRWKRGIQITGSLAEENIPWVSKKTLSKNPHGLILPSSQERAPTVSDQFYWESIWRISHSVTHFWNQLDIPFEVRHPLLYLPLVKFMYKLPWKYKLSATQDRILQREALKKILPLEIYSRKDKKGPDEAFRRALSASHELLDQLYEHSVAVDLGYLDGDHWRSTIKKAKIGLAPPNGQFTSALTFEIWLQMKHNPSFMCGQVTKVG